MQWIHSFFPLNIYYLLVKLDVENLSEGMIFYCTASVCAAFQVNDTKGVHLIFPFLGEVLAESAIKEGHWSNLMVLKKGRE